jgi:hypothetical protein
MVPTLKNGLKLGKKPARPDAMMLSFGDFVDRSKIPPIPDTFGHDRLIGVGDWGMLGNDQAGDCVLAAQAHAVMLWNQAAGRTVKFTEQSVLADYSAVTGYNPADSSTDQGTDMVLGAEYFRTTGMMDDSGKRHKIAVDLSIKPGQIEDLWAAAYLGVAVAVGVNLPASAETQFDDRQPWSYDKVHSGILGGHAILLTARAGNLLDFVSWGRRQYASLYWYSRFADEAVAFVSDEMLNDAGKNPDGFDRNAVIDAISSLA